MKTNLKIWIEYKGGRVLSAKIPVDPVALAMIYRATFKHLRKRNPQFTDDQLETATFHLIPQVCYRLYKEKRRK